MVEETWAVKLQLVHIPHLYNYDDGHLFGASVKLAYDDSKTTLGNKDTSGVGNEYRAQTLDIRI